MARKTSIEKIRRLMDAELERLNDEYQAVQDEIAARTALLRQRLAEIHKQRNAVRASITALTIPLGGTLEEVHTQATVPTTKRVRQYAMAHAAETFTISDLVRWAAQEDLGISRPSITMACNTLFKQKILDRVGLGQYRLIQAPAEESA